MKRWSRQYDNCVRCHETQTKHTARGLCVKCYGAQYLSDNYERCSKQKHDSYIRRGGNEFAKIQREQRHYSGVREDVLKRDGYRCVKCGSCHQLVVHHKDGNGRGHKNPNNDIANLETLCRACHIKAHRRQIQSGRGFIYDAKWSPKYGLEACRECNKSDAKHNSEGLCTRCHALKYYQSNSERLRQARRDRQKRKKLQRKHERETNRSHCKAGPVRL